MGHRPGEVEDYLGFRHWRGAGSAGLLDSTAMQDKIRRVRCGTPKCSGFVDTRVSTEPKSKEGNWQFECPICHSWSLLSEVGMVRATSREKFDLERLPSSLRNTFPVRREPPGGV